MRPRHGVSRTIIAIALGVAAIIVGSSFYLLAPMVGNVAQSQSPSSSSSATTTLTFTSSASTSSTSSTNAGLLPMSFTPEPPVISSYLPLNYTLYFVPLGPVPSPLTVTLTSPASISMRLFPQTVAVPGPVPPYVNMTVSMRPSASVAPGLYPVVVQATGEGQNYTQTLQVQVVRYLIVSYCLIFEPQPTTYTIPVNSSVTWLRLNSGERNGCILGVDVGLINAVIPSLNVSSPNLLQFHSLTYTFTKPGTYPFYCAFYPNTMKGVITVTP